MSNRNAACLVHGEVDFDTMPLLLAFEPVPDRAARLTALVAAHLAADLVVVTTIGEAQAALAGRRPDLVLVSPVLDSAEKEALRSTLVGDAGLLPGVPTLAIPPLADEAPPERPRRGLLGRLRRPRARRGVHACEPGRSQRRSPRAWHWPPPSGVRMPMPPATRRCASRSWRRPSTCR